ncbi:class I SAM-dependent methyltransferase [Streptomyces sp. BHT-5-2]|uniref:methyltransferase n=1 Tax=Streptomyces sp. BHT-5-2 TaxID=2866715 RepID=UPI001C8DA212|nr:methyltransferase [Streptomyces sp. BHT-5-2]QZL06416.1 class I SAM-dependent methyltransferase [Streptomyces sp. BHT-5-2]
MDDDAEVMAGQEVYSERVLKFYDLLVLRLTSSFVWRCPPGVMARLHERNLGERHLELGVGTGYFLDRGRFPVPRPAIDLVDLNPDALAHAARRLARYRPGVHRANVLEPLPVPDGTFDSVGMNLLLHCLPGGSLRAKESVVKNAATAARKGGRVFGSTILAEGVEVNPAARAMLRNHNERGILQNAGDSLADLQWVLHEHLTDVVIRVRGCIALFEATAG